MVYGILKYLLIYSVETCQCLCASRLILIYILSIHYWNPAQWYIHVPCFLQNTKNNHWSEFDKRNIFKSSLIVSNAICCKNSYCWTTYIFFSLSWFWAQFLDLSKCLQIYVKYLALTILNILCIWFILDKSCMHVIAAGL